MSKIQIISETGIVVILEDNASIADGLQYCMENTNIFSNNETICIIDCTNKKAKFYKAQLTMEIVNYV